MEDYLKQHFDHSQRLKEQYEPELVSLVKDLSKFHSRCGGQHYFHILGCLGENYFGLRSLNFRLVEALGKDKMKAAFEHYALQAALHNHQGNRAPRFCIGVKFDDFWDSYGMIVEDLSEDRQKLIVDRFDKGGIINSTGKKVWYDLVDVCDPLHHKISEYLFLADENVIDLSMF